MARKNRKVTKNANIRKLIQDEKDQQAELAKKQKQRKDNALEFAKIVEERAKLLKTSISTGATLPGASIFSGSLASISPDSLQKETGDSVETKFKKKKLLKMLGRVGVKKNKLKQKKNRKTREEKIRAGRVGRLLKEELKKRAENGTAFPRGSIFSGAPVSTNDDDDDAMDEDGTPAKRKTALKKLGRLGVKKSQLKPKKTASTQQENRAGQVGKRLKERRLSENKRDRLTVVKQRMVNLFGEQTARLRSVEPRREKLVRRQLEKRERIGPKGPKRTASGKKKLVKLTDKKRDRLEKRAQRREGKKLRKARSGATGKAEMQGVVTGGVPPPAS